MNRKNRTRLPIDVVGLDHVGFCLHQRIVYQLTALIALAALADVASAQGSLDRVRRLGGVDSGKVTSTSALGITLEKGGVDKKIPAEDIISVYFAGEPEELNSARMAIETGRYQDALELLGEVDVDDIDRDEVVSDVEYFRLVAEARLASRRDGIDSAIANVTAFLASNKKSFHIPAAIELLGDLYAAAGQYEQARANYAKLGKAPSPFYKLKSAWLVGQTWQAEGDYEKARGLYEQVVASTERSAAIDPIRLAATLDMAVSNAAAGDATGSKAAIDKIIEEADPEDADLLARAFNALGDAQLEAGDKQAAKLAYLHVHLLYSSAESAHARALSQLIPLWEDSGHADRARQAAEILSRDYPNHSSR